MKCYIFPPSQKSNRFSITVSFPFFSLFLRKTRLTLCLWWLVRRPFVAERYVIVHCKVPPGHLFSPSPHKLGRNRTFGSLACHRNVRVIFSTSSQQTRETACVLKCITQNIFLRNYSHGSNSWKSSPTTAQFIISGKCISAVEKLFNCSSKHAFPPTLYHQLLIDLTGNGLRLLRQ